MKKNKESTGKASHLFSSIVSALACPHSGGEFNGYKVALELIPQWLELDPAPDDVEKLLDLLHNRLEGNRTILGILIAKIRGDKLGELPRLKNK